MSKGAGVPWAVAAELARQVSDALAPVVVRSKAAGSVRRRKPYVSDIEFVAEPLERIGDLFGGETHDIDSIRETCARMGRIAKGGDRYIQVADVLGSGVALDLFLCYAPAQWGSILAIRTGPARLGQWAVTQMRTRGYRHTEGHVERIADGVVMPTPKEADFFAFAGLPCVRPVDRDTPAAFALSR